MPDPTLLNKIKMRLYENDISNIIIDRNLIQSLKLIRLSYDTNYAFFSIRMPNVPNVKYYIEIVNEEYELWEEYKVIEENEIYRTDYEMISFTPTLNKKFKLIISNRV